MNDKLFLCIWYVPNAKLHAQDIYSVKFRNLVNSSNSSCKSPSDILFCRLGINDLASSALSQHRLPVPVSAIEFAMYAV